MSALPSPVTVARLVRSDLLKLSRYWVVLGAYGAMAVVAVGGAALYHLAEARASIHSGSGWDFAFAVMLRSLDFSRSVLFLMFCLVFTLDTANATLKYVLTRPVTRLELLASRYATALVMIAATLALLWAGSLGAAAWYYDLGALTENDYVIFPAATMARHVAIATGLVAIVLLSIASLAVAVSTYATTMGGAILTGLVLFTMFGTLGLVPASLGVDVPWDGGTVHVPYSTASFMNQVFVPMYLLDDLPTGIPIDTWWTAEVRRMLAVSLGTTLVFGAIAAAGAHRRDYTL